MRKWMEPLLLAFVILFWSASIVMSAPVTVTMLAEYREAYLDWQQDMVAEFERLHPNIKIELIPTTGGTVTQKMQVMLASGTPIDIGFMDPYLILDWVREGIVEDLTPYYEKSKAQFSDWYPPVMNLFRLNNGLYALPLDMQIGTVFYNVDLFDGVGLPYPKPGWTYDQLAQYAKRLTQRGPTGTVTRYGYRIPSVRNWPPVVWAFGGDIVDDWNNPTQFTGNQPAVANALSYLADLVRSEAAPNKALNNRFPQAGGFTNQTLAMVQTNTIAMDTYYPIDAFEWNVAPLPVGPDGQGTYVNAIGWFMFSYSTCKNEAWEVLKFFTSPSVLQSRVEQAGVVPPSASLIQRVWLPSRTKPKDRGSLLMGIDSARSPLTLTKELWTIIDSNALQAIWGEVAASSAITNMEAQFNAMLAEIKKR